MIVLGRREVVGLGRSPEDGLNESGLCHRARRWQDSVVVVGNDDLATFPRTRDSITTPSLPASVVYVGYTSVLTSTSGIGDTLCSTTYAQATQDTRTVWRDLREELKGSR